MNKELLHASLLDILPQNLLRDEKIKAAAQALDAELQKITEATKEALLLPRLSELSEAVIDLLAWQWHVDFYEPTLGIGVKRRLVRESIAMHRIKGTKAAVELALRMTRHTGDVIEWFEYGGKPYCFQVSGIRADSVHPDGLRSLLRLIYAMKNERSWLENIDFVRPVRIDMYYGVLSSSGKQYRIGAPQAKDAVIKGGMYYGAAVCPCRAYCIASPQANGAVITGGTYRGAVPSIYREVVIHE